MKRHAASYECAFTICAANIDVLYDHKWFTACDNLCHSHDGSKTRVYIGQVIEEAHTSKGALQVKLALALARHLHTSREGLARTIRPSCYYERFTPVR